MMSQVRCIRRAGSMCFRQISDGVFSPPLKITEMYAIAGESKFSGINAPTAGARTLRRLPRGQADVQLYSLGTPNGQKVSILFEELGIDYDAHRINIMDSDQFTTGFVEVNPNSKIPAVVHYCNDGKPINLFESGSIMLYFAEMHKTFIAPDIHGRAGTLNWLFWQMAGQGPITGNFGHFFAYAPEHEVASRNYGVHRYGMEVQRLCSVLDNHLSCKSYMVNEEYSVADMACFPWFQMLRKGAYRCNELKCSDFLDIAANYPNAVKWAERIEARPAVQRGMTVCGLKSEHVKPWLHPQD